MEVLERLREEKSDEGKAWRRPFSQAIIKNKRLG